MSMPIYPVLRSSPTSVSGAAAAVGKDPETAESKSNFNGRMITASSPMYPILRPLPISVTGAAAAVTSGSEEAAASKSDLNGRMRTASSSSSWSSSSSAGGAAAAAGGSEVAARAQDSTARAISPKAEVLSLLKEVETYLKSSGLEYKSALSAAPGAGATSCIAGKQESSFYDRIVVFITKVADFCNSPCSIDKLDEYFLLVAESKNIYAYGQSVTNEVVTGANPEVAAQITNCGNSVLLYDCIGVKLAQALEKAFWGVSGSIDSALEEINTDTQKVVEEANNLLEYPNVLIDCLEGVKNKFEERIELHTLWFDALNKALGVCYPESYQILSDMIYVYKGAEIVVSKSIKERAELKVPERQLPAQYFQCIGELTIAKHTMGKVEANLQARHADSKCVIC